MKKVLLSLCVASAMLYCIPANAQTKRQKVDQTRNNDNALNKKLSGAWQSVDNRTFVMLFDSFYSQIRQDSTGKLGYVESGTYTIDGTNSVTLNVRYASVPSHIGALHTVEYEINGETLTVKSFKKLVDAKEGDITARMPKGQQTTFRRAIK
jgi:hypothetical protein